VGIYAARSSHFQVILDAIGSTIKLEVTNRKLYLAVPVIAHEAFFQRDFLQMSVERHQVSRIVYDPVNEAIVQWIN
jgi:XisH protein